MIKQNFFGYQTWVNSGYDIVVAHNNVFFNRCEYTNYSRNGNGIGGKMQLFRCLQDEYAGILTAIKKASSLAVRKILCVFAHTLQAYLSCCCHETMGTYINKGNNAFRDIITHEYVDKTSLIPLINATLNSERRYSRVTRCRRFGKSMAAKMLCAYYDKSCDSKELLYSEQGGGRRDEQCHQGHILGAVGQDHTKLKSPARCHHRRQRPDQAQGLPLEDCRLYRRHPACRHQLQPGDKTAHLQDRKGGHRLKPYHPEKGYKHQRHLFLLKLTQMGRPSNFKKR